MGGNPQAPSSAAAAATAEISQPADALEGSGIIRLDNDSEFPQVLVSFRITRGDFDYRTWVSWLLGAPVEARELIKVEGFYGSFSSLLLLRMPIKVWDLLPDSPAISFVGFITTTNQGHHIQKEVDDLLQVTDAIDSTPEAFDALFKENAQALPQHSELPEKKERERSSDSDSPGSSTQAAEKSSQAFTKHVPDVKDGVDFAHGPEPTLSRNFLARENFEGLPAVA